MQALVVGDFESYEQHALGFASERASTTVRFFATFDAACHVLQQPDSDVTCIFVDKHECAAVSNALRNQARFFATPIVALVPHASDAEYQTAYSAGADDAMSRADLGGITRRLANLRDRPHDMRPPNTQGHALVAFPDILKRRIVGRTLRNAGFNVSYAEAWRELERTSKQDPPPTMLVIHPDFPEGGRNAQGAIDRVRALTGNASLPALLLAAYPRERSTDQTDSDPDEAGKLLFFAEEALRGDSKVMRTSPRVHTNRLCAFREEGSLQPIFGLTHNISEQGLYVRTFDPPRPGSTLWFELRTPGDEPHMIHLRGRVVWRREPKMMGGAAPAGFGIRIEDVLCPSQDLEYYRASYEELTAHHQQTQPSLSPALPTNQNEVAQ